MKNQQQIDLQDLFATIGEQQVTIRILQQKIAVMQAAIDDMQKPKEEK